MDDVKIMANITPSKYDYPIMEQNISAVESSYRTSVISVGILLNCFVLIVVSFSRQLHYPRHLFWAAISIFECIFLLDNALELFTVHNRNYSTCPFVVVLYPIDYSILLVCLSMAAFDRYVSIVSYDWYQANVTNRGVILSISIAVAVTFFIFSGPFWTGYKSIYTCTSNVIRIFLIFAWNLLLGILCVILHFMIYFKTTSFISRYAHKYRRKSVTVKFVAKSSIRKSSGSGTRMESNWAAEQILFSASDRQTIVSILPQVPPPLVIIESELSPSQPIDNQDDTLRSPWKWNRSKVSRFEIQAALNLSVSILPFWLCTLPVACYSIALFWCIRLESSCDTIVLTWNYLWDVFIFHSIYNPILYMITYSEFLPALRHLVKKFSAKFNLIL